MMKNLRSYSMDEERDIIILLDQAITHLCEDKKEWLDRASLLIQEIRTSGVELKRNQDMLNLFVDWVVILGLSGMIGSALQQSSSVLRLGMIISLAVIIISLAHFKNTLENQRLKQIKQATESSKDITERLRTSFTGFREIQTCLRKWDNQQLAKAVRMVFTDDYLHINTTTRTVLWEVLSSASGYDGVTLDTTADICCSWEDHLSMEYMGRTFLTRKSEVAKRMDQLADVLERKIVEAQKTLEEALRDNTDIKLECLKSKTGGLLVETAVMEWETMDVPHKMKQKLIDETGGKIELPNVVLSVPSSAVHQPLIMYVTQRENAHIRIKEMESVGYEDAFKPLMELSLQPHGQTLAQPAHLIIKNVKLTENEKVLIFHKDVHPDRETFWTDITAECHIELGEDGVHLEVGRFCDVWGAVIMNIVTLGLKYAVEALIAYLNRTLQQCDFYAYYRPPSPFLLMVAGASDGDSSDERHYQPKGSACVGMAISKYPLADKEDLGFYCNTSKRSAARIQLNLEQCRKNGQHFKIQLESGITVENLKTVNISRKRFYVLNQNICCMNIGWPAEGAIAGSANGVTSSNPYRRSLPYYTETKKKKLSRLNKYIEHNHRDEYINAHLSEIAKRMRTNPELLENLVVKNVITDREMTDIQIERNPHARNHALIQVIRTVPNDRYLDFLDSLAEKQEDLVELLTGREWKQREGAMNSSEAVFGQENSSRYYDPAPSLQDVCNLSTDSLSGYHYRF